MAPTPNRRRSDMDRCWALASVKGSTRQAGRYGASTVAVSPTTSRKVISR